jgi:CDP-diacylglycerol--serine O-phosphatidyltransferase
LGFTPPEGFSLVEAIYVLFIAFMMISRIPTYAGKTLGSRVPREWVVPLFVLVIAIVGLLVTYPFEFLTVTTLLYLILIPVGYRRYKAIERAQSGAEA